MEKTKEMNPIETKEIRGMNLRNLIAIVICTASVVTTFFSLKSSMDEIRVEVREVKNERSNQVKYDDLRFQILEIRDAATETKIKELNTKYDELIRNTKPNN